MVNMGFQLLFRLRLSHPALAIDSAELAVGQL